MINLPMSMLMPMKPMGNEMATMGHAVVPADDAIPLTGYAMLADSSASMDGLLRYSLLRRMIYSLSNNTNIQVYNKYTLSIV